MDIRPISPGEEREAAACLLEASLGKPPEAREVDAFLERARALGTDLSRQIVAVAPDGRLAGVLLYDVAPDASVTASPPACRKPFDDPSLSRALLQALRRTCVAQGFEVLQVFSDEDDTEVFAVLSECGLKRLALLLFMERRIDEDDRNIPSAPEIRWIPFSQEAEGDFARVVERTYEKTLDCPKLNEAGRVRGRLAGYRRGPAFAPELWMIAEVGGEATACLLQNVRPEEDSYELAYVGVVPEHRGKGLGRRAVEHALRVLGEREGSTRLWLAVDSANTPAVNTYNQLGFTIYDRRVVYFSLLAHDRAGVRDTLEKSSEGS